MDLLYFVMSQLLKHAQLVAKSGADALIAVSQGAGGHAGNINPLP